MSAPVRRLQELKDKHRDVMQEMLMDVLRALSSPNMDIRKKTLDISLDLITARNIDEVRRRWPWEPPSSIKTSAWGGALLAVAGRQDLQRANVHLRLVGPGAPPPIPRRWCWC